MLIYVLKATDCLDVFMEYGKTMSCFTGVREAKGSMSKLEDSSTNELQKKGVALILGAEGQGLSDASRRSSLPIRIPMSGAMESLCVSQAGAILLFLLGTGSPYSLAQLEVEPRSMDSLKW